MMKLFYAKTSPYARVVLVMAKEKGLGDRVEVETVDPWTDPPALRAASPLGRVPVLVTDDGEGLPESPAIARYLEAADDAVRLIPDGDAGWPVLRLAALAHGTIDAAFVAVMERRRPADRQVPELADRRLAAIRRSVPVLANSRDWAGDPPFDYAGIAVACLLDYLDFRLPETGWRDGQPGLAAWFEAARQRPSMRGTDPR